MASARCAATGHALPQATNLALLIQGQRRVAALPGRAGW